MPLKIDAATSPLEEIIRTKDGQISDLEKRIFELQEFIPRENLVSSVYAKKLKRRIESVRCQIC
jgi:hypothetical protein